ncbi:helix-turn-helix transcriptional regulator [Pseudoalteromonas carrageenovora]|uniref:helix-turn-helix domain-containing protein n=1 Tax=Pseudoalteromonas carrageenovora TaxID=227 RepID=UPI0026E16C5F|nr:helix-turn-helix transcriptional regulator [Pseudoalteromonas carrageenovora]MDO6636838.1 helix-turn-helix transcriptional regulator [Pseudoalteromonas carrageenovora]MDO6649054.1 helix-turn-helix transcriptional regulator [Pseudoalteromonas carrageenovora]
MKEISIQFGINLRNKRKELKIPQEKMAFLADIDRSYMGRIERGEVNITLIKAYTLAEALDCNIRELLP